MHGRPTGEEASRRLAEYLAASERAGARGGTFAIVAGVASVLVAIVPYLIAVIARA